MGGGVGRRAGRLGSRIGGGRRKGLRGRKGCRGRCDDWRVGELLDKKEGLEGREDVGIQGDGDGAGEI